MKRKLMSFMMPKEFDLMTALYHATLFTLNDKIAEFMSEKGILDYIYPNVIEVTQKVGSEVGLEIGEKSTIEDAFNAFVSIMRKSLLISGGKIIKGSDGEYELHLEGCMMSRGGHKAPSKMGFCPMGISCAALVKKASGKNVSIKSITLTEKGSITRIALE